LINPSSPEIDEVGPVLTTVDENPSLNPSSPVQETDEDGPVPKNVGDTQLIDDPLLLVREADEDVPVPKTDAVAATIIANNNSQEDATNQAEISVQLMNHAVTSISAKNSPGSSRNTSDDDSNSSSPCTPLHSPRNNSSPVSTRSTPSSSSCNTSDDDSDSSVASSPRTPPHASRKKNVERGNCLFFNSEQKHI
jgi:hypothetical protein